MAEIFYVPPVNTKGVFTFKSPYDKTDKIGKTEELTVIAIRSLMEIYKNDERPYETIYLPQGLTAADYQDDLDNEVPVVVFKRTNTDLYYVPADRISATPDITGYKYRDIMLAAKLGSLPLEYDFTKLIKNIQEGIYDSIGIETTVVMVPRGAVNYVDETKHTTLMKLIDNRASVKLSYQNKYLKILEENTVLKKTIATLEKELLKK